MTKPIKKISIYSIGTSIKDDLYIYIYIGIQGKCWLDINYFKDNPYNRLKTYTA